jgi:hypothetical protein
MRLCAAHSLLWEAFRQEAQVREEGGVSPDIVSCILRQLLINPNLTLELLKDTLFF